MLNSKEIGRIISDGVPLDIRVWLGRREMLEQFRVDQVGVAVSEDAGIPPLAVAELDVVSAHLSFELGVLRLNSELAAAMSELALVSVLTRALK